jgi:WD40 repeat protein
MLLATAVAAAVEPPPPRLPEKVEPERTGAVNVGLAVDFARREAAKAAEAARLLAEVAEETIRKAAPADKAVADAKTVEANARGALDEVTAALNAATAAKETGDKQLADTLRALDEAIKFAQKASAELAALIEKKGVAEKKVQASAEQTAQAETTAKPLLAAKADAQSAAVEAEKQSLAAKERLSVLQSSELKADPREIRLVRTFKHHRPLISCRIDSAGEFVYAGVQDKDLQRWDLVSGGRTALTGHQSWVRRFEIHENNDLLVTGAYEGRLIWWNPQETAPKPQRIVEAHQGFVRGVSISPDAEFVATGGNDNVVRIWSVTDATLVRELRGHESHVYNVKFDPTGKYLVSGDLMGVVKQWEYGTWNHVRDLDAGLLHKYDEGFRAHCGGTRGMDFSPEGDLLVVAGIGEVTNAFAMIGVPTALVFDMATGDRLTVLKPAENFKGSLWSVSVHPSGRFLVCTGGSGSGRLWFWRFDEEKSFFDFKLPGVGYDVDFHPDGLRLAVALFDKTLRLYDLGPKPDVTPEESTEKK